MRTEQEKWLYSPLRDALLPKVYSDGSQPELQRAYEDYRAALENAPQQPGAGYQLACQARRIEALEAQIATLTTQIERLVVALEARVAEAAGFPPNALKHSR